MIAEDQLIILGGNNVLFAVLKYIPVSYKANGSYAKKMQLSFGHGLKLAKLANPKSPGVLNIDDRTKSLQQTHALSWFGVALIKGNSFN